MRTFSLLSISRLSNETALGTILMFETLYSLFSAALATAVWAMIATGRRIPRLNKRSFALRMNQSTMSIRSHTGPCGYMA